jgi:hypothetical protein
MRKARAIMLDEDMFAFAYGCESHAISNLCRDVPKLPKALSAWQFATTMAKVSSNRHLREHIRFESAKLPPTSPTLKLYAQTRWTGCATLQRTVMQNREAIITVFFKPKQKVIDMDFDNIFFEAAMGVSTLDAIAEREPKLRYISVVTDYLQSDTSPCLRPYVLLIPLNCRGVVFGPRAGSVDD